MGMFAERNLRYPEDRERLARALKSREAFEAFIVSGAGMLDFDGARRGQLGAAADAAAAAGNEFDWTRTTLDDVTTTLVTPVLADAGRETSTCHSFV